MCFFLDLRAFWQFLECTHKLKFFISWYLDILVVILHRIFILIPSSFFLEWALFGGVPFSWFVVHAFTIVNGWVSCNQWSSLAGQMSPCRAYVAWGCGLCTCRVHPASSPCGCGVLLRGHVAEYVPLCGAPPCFYCSRSHCTICSSLVFAWRYLILI